MKNKEPFQRYFFPALWWLFTITVLSMVSGVRLPKFNLFSSDKLVHAFVYGYLVWLFMWGFYKKDPSLITHKRGFGLFLFASIWGMLMEFIQGAMPHRSFEWDDEIANAFGALVGWLVARWWFLRKK